MKANYHCILLAVAIALVCGALGSGCRSMSEPGSASFASVTISNKSAAQIQDAAVAVFGQHGYQGFASSSGPIFQKEGSRGNNLAYGGPVNTYYGAQTVVRVKTEIVELGGESRRLQCQAFVVRNAGDAFFEHETRLSNLRRGPYQKLLDEVAKRLK